MWVGWRSSGVVKCKGAKRADHQNLSPQSWQAKRTTAAAGWSDSHDHARGAQGGGNTPGLDSGLDSPRHRHARSASLFAHGSQVPTGCHLSNRRTAYRCMAISKLAPQYAREILSGAYTGRDACASSTAAPIPTTAASNRSPTFITIPLHVATAVAIPIATHRDFPITITVPIIISMAGVTIPISMTINMPIYVTTTASIPTQIPIAIFIAMATPPPGNRYLPQHHHPHTIAIAMPIAMPLKIGAHVANAGTMTLRIAHSSTAAVPVPVAIPCPSNPHSYQPSYLDGGAITIRRRHRYLNADQHITIAGMPRIIQIPIAGHFPIRITTDISVPMSIINYNGITIPTTTAVNIPMAIHIPISSMLDSPIIIGSAIAKTIKTLAIAVAIHMFVTIAVTVGIVITIDMLIPRQMAEAMPIVSTSTIPILTAT
ncbi:hypothetical protein FN846DRAFT_885749 [Sphaerosporella brunnea]|uniref:Uncharacterized protein n=1 Tax=Sphaerosporella brunnea TaxID=1250544 RepID=A0A5J5FBL2_9PEZI|nr:hypothetical protein FN846DRAFT_885749 [Sphaerosporella brunnea]